ncbi:hypothetical protein GA0074696_4014 [Micromonospora purpureochromogenes]|uniref:Uncharacterized protein n=1 Tax=Micromonospora purpureochromogenes TaxID=47872 RepID=A0A1C4Z470_9ACTN|nr:hypothetical protein [Micromonospora purpureochromogenes]SCF27706.1 hypothetical protein GA0074696_4014 [Micromonospora purpureochromogenes]
MTMTPVLERWSGDCPFWPVAPGPHLVAVPCRAAPEQVGAVLWALVAPAVTDDDLSAIATSAAEAIEAYLAAGDNGYAAGGLRVSDGNVVIDPGCCVGLDEWREWGSVLHGQPPYLGHDPDVFLEDRGAVLRLWQHVAAVPPGDADLAGPHVDIPRAQFPGLLRGVRRDLTGLLAELDGWARAAVPGLAGPLVAAVDARLAVTAPLEP